jgi:murein DD-endopeptidase MepM/ murein hydrolase activator NlpD
MAQVAGGGQSRVFGKRKENHLLILASGEKVRHMTIRPWMAALTVSAFGLFTIAYLAATAYLVVRDDLIGASMARQARMQHEYEDRIASLRAQIDRITSRQMLDQQVVEDKVEKLLEQQMALTTRQGKLGSVLERAENSGLDTQQPVISPNALTEPDKHAGLTGQDAFRSLLGNTIKASDTPFRTRALAFNDQTDDVADRADQLFSKVTLSLKAIEQEQLSHIQNLTADAADRADAIGRILENTGVSVPERLADADSAEDDNTAMGGPFVEPETAAEFESSITGLDLALDRLEKVKTLARKLPFGNPAPDSQITSTFGNRLDPFFGRLAMHAGIDFRRKVGDPVRATAPGIVIAAGPAGGYGNMVEIDHGNGLTTRYGHLSKILVSKGDRIDESTIIALAGSTGRSTGPHLHYEVRRNGQAVDPMRFLNAGLKLDNYID